MLGLRHAAICTTLLLPTPLLAAEVFRCTDADGQVSFTRHGCPSSHEQQIQNAHNPRPGSGAAVPLAKPASSQTQTSASNKGSTLTVVGERQDGCDNQITGSERREAIIRKQVRTGMSRRDVESALGRPERTSQRNGQTTYHYSVKFNGERRSVTFDQDGCVKGKR